MSKADTYRIDYLDIAKGVAVILMIVGHSYRPPALSAFIYSFHMPIFFFISGYLRKERPFKKNLWAWSKSLIAPYVVVAAITCVLAWLYNLLYNQYGVGAAGVPYGVVDILIGISDATPTFPEACSFGPIWFLICIFWSKFIYEIILKITYNCREWVKCVIVLIVVCFGYIINLVYGALIWSLDVSCVSIFFMYAGRLLKLYEDEECRLSQSITFVINTVGVIFWVMLILCGGINMAHRYYPYMPLCLLGAVGGSCVIIYLCKYIAKIRWLSNYLMLWGRSSMILLCAHNIEKSFFPYGRMCGLLRMEVSEISVMICRFLVLHVVLILLYIKQQYKTRRVLNL